ncbi:MAG: metalloregulator ArsR/SmtB family transcription factor [Armatimonadota bacterium]|nr:metalloregulator ArsR/SmtB family transcription factor [Armatimonadota bacterium]MDR7518568.1 metalloregulator ArsR/SmtB family transcription factor [Armatimonadota bacterium]MDR7551162.1 metalloregulator ArsR/SmtB family transcription factor [Armatimonadota bacterium]
MKVIDLTAPPRELRVRIDPSPAYDFLACLYLLSCGEESLDFEMSPRWIAQARAALGPELRADLSLLLPWRGRTLGLVGVMDGHQGLSVREFIKRVAATPADDLLELMLAESLADRHALPLLRSAIGRSGQAVEAFVAAIHPDIDRRPLRRLVSMPPAEVKARLARLLREGYARVYAPREGEVVPLLERDAAALVRRAATVSGSELIEYATGGFVVGPDAPVMGVVLAPTYYFRPYNLITAYHGVRVYVYPLETSPHSGAPPADLVRFYKALADETRLRILRLLAGREMYLQELAKALGLSHVTVLHHIALLRAARLVQIVERGNAKYYRLRADRAREAATLWQEFAGPQEG